MRIQECTLWKGKGKVNYPTQRGMGLSACTIGGAGLVVKGKGVLRG
jgi:hypothetical protein